MRPLSRRLSAALAAGLLLWAGWGAGVEAWRASAVLASRRAPHAVAFWRLGDDRPEALRRFLAEVGRRVGDDDVVAVVTAAGEGDQDFFLGLWAAYLLPRQRVIRLAHRRARSEADWLVAWGTRIDHPRLTPVLERPAGVLYRVAPP